MRTRGQGREESDVDIWWTLHFKREPASVPLARRILLGAMEAAGVEPQISHETGIALTEACANAVEHAGGPGLDEGFQVTASIDGDRLRIEVMDCGPGRPPVDLALPALSVPLLTPAAPRAERRPAAVPVAPVHKTPARTAPRCQTKRNRTTVISRAAVMASLSPAAKARRAHPADHPGPYETHLLDAHPATAPTPPALPPDIGTELPDPTAESGRGIFLIRALADHVQFRHHPHRGAIISFDKVLKWRDGALLRAVS